MIDLEISSKQLGRLVKDKDVTLLAEESLVEPDLGVEKIVGRPLVIGAGPAGLLAALELARYGYRPLILERGKPVAQRVDDVQRFWKDGKFDPDSNVQFGEGGAEKLHDWAKLPVVSQKMTIYDAEQRKKILCRLVLLRKFYTNISRMWAQINYV